MELTIQKKSLLKGLARAHNVADRKGSMAILSNILFRAEPNKDLSLAATDLYLGVNARSEANIQKEGSIAVNAKTIYDIVKNLPEGEVHWVVTEQNAEIRCGKVHYKLPGMSGDDFPPLPNPEDAIFHSVSADALSQLIASTHFSMSSDESRPHLAGALLEGDANLVRMVTTDGHRLSKAEIELKDPNTHLKFSLLTPHKGVTELRRLLDEVKADSKAKEDLPIISLAPSKGNLFVRTHTTELSIKLSDEQFPPYEKVIPPDQKHRIAVDRASFIEALKRIALVANDKSGGVRFELTEGLLKVSSENPEVGQGFEEMEVDYAADPIRIGFNARYVLDALQALDSDEVFLDLSGELDPMVIRPAESAMDYVGVIMPMRI